MDGCACCCGWVDVSYTLESWRRWYVPKAPATLMAERANVVNCILEYIFVLKIQISNNECEGLELKI